EAALSVRFAESGFKQGYLEISDYPVQYDNRFYFTLPVNSNLQVLHIYQSATGSGSGGLSTGNAAVAKIFKDDSLFRYISVPVTKIDYSVISSARLVIIDEVRQIPDVLSSALKQAVEKGASVVLIPAAGASGAAGVSGVFGAASDVADSASGVSNTTGTLPYSNILYPLTGANIGIYKNEETKVTGINFDNPVFKMALADNEEEGALPTVKSRYIIPVNVSVPSEALMSFSSSEDFMRVYEIGSGFLYLLSSPISKEYTDFTSGYSFVVSFLNMALYSRASADLYSTVGSAGGVNLAQITDILGDSPFTLTGSSGGDFSVIPQVRNINSEMLLFTNGVDVPSGNYLLKKNNAVVGGLSFNDSRKEGVQEYYSASELEKFGVVLDPSKVSVSNALSYVYGGRALWKWFIIAALVMLAAETFLLRWIDIKAWIASRRATPDASTRL
ncbi:MAG: hypothetical protein LBF01_04505, partial [Bacteroidales bacterium]|nr:hypothetical protein [Bacteroidales bacterium]